MKKGEPKVFHHGSKKSGDITTFRNRQYFTESKAYAERYADIGYDMILPDEGGDMVNGKPVSRGISYVVKSSDQIKSATDNIGTFDRGTGNINNYYKIQTDRRDLPEEALNKTDGKTKTFARKYGALFGKRFEPEPDIREKQREVNRLYEKAA